MTFLLAVHQKRNMLSDLRYALRKLWRSPGFTIAAVCCLALGIGANSAAFSFAKSLLFPSPAISEPDRLVRLFVRSPAQQYGAFAYPDFSDLKSEREVFSELIAERPLSLRLSDDEQSQVIWGSLVSGDYFRALGVTISMGRDFAVEEDRTPGTHPVVIISHRLWQQRFGGRQEVIGDSIHLNGQACTLIGVTPPSFRGIHVGLRTECWVPMMMQRQLMPGADLLQARGCVHLPSCRFIWTSRSISRCSVLPCCWR